MKISLLYFLIFLRIHAYGEITSAEVDVPHLLKFRKCWDERAEKWQLITKSLNRTFYDKLNVQFYENIDKVYPLAIVTPTSSSDVQIAVKCGVKTNLQLVPVSGGHSYAQLSAGTNDSILIDFRYMRNISISLSIDRNETVVTVESGTFLGHLYGTLWKNGRLGAPLGSCNTVAIGGLVIGGGIGYFSSVFGLVIDNLIEINMVDASGNAIRVNETHHVDLWWAMRGVGPGYIGLVTSVKLRVFKADELKLTYLVIRYHNSSFKHVMESFVEWLNWVKENDPSINSVISIHSKNFETVASEPARPDGKETEVQILQTRNHTDSPNLNFIAAALTIFSGAIDANITFPNFFEFSERVSYTPVNNYNKSWSNEERIDYFSSLTRESKTDNFHKAKSFFVKKPFKAKHLDAAEEILQTIPNHGAILITSEQGAVGLRKSIESAYVHRDALFNFKIFFETENVANATEIEEGVKWMNKFFESVKFLDSGNTYQNYPERNLTHYLDRYYGTNLKQLIDIKRKWDPNHYFNSEMSLPINYP